MEACEYYQHQKDFLTTQLIFQGLKCVWFGGFFGGCFLWLLVVCLVVVLGFFCFLGFDFVVVFFLCVVFLFLFLMKMG